MIAAGPRAAVAFLTPFGGARSPRPSALAWFPAVGLALGGALGGLWWLAARAWPVPVAAALVVAADLAATGLLHVDGLVDCGDGLLAHLTRERRLAVMAEPQVGAFGVAVCAATLLVRFAALAALRPAPLLLAGLWCVSRSGMALVVRTQPYARREGGLASAWSGPGAPPPILLASGVAVGVAAAMLWKPLAGGVAALTAIVATVATVALARRRLGGYTGDVVGAAGMLAETFGLVAAAAKW
jgi:adenosylcobinamide-GDP ribazoletransferase